jgi:hypothetical protein
MTIVTIRVGGMKDGVIVTEAGLGVQTYVMPNSTSGTYVNQILFSESTETVTLAPTETARECEGMTNFTAQPEKTVLGSDGDRVIEML